ncbi:TPA: hypothetical protein EYP26_00685 [Candidatus Bathyarchaeota archaeon]|nr:hypothetical protein [Candidatus Bathyarchaeota archaeon]
MIIRASFIISTATGIIATLAVAFHELPQEIADLAALIYGGLRRKTALTLNLATALTAIFGAPIVSFLISLQFWLHNWLRWRRLYRIRCRVDTRATGGKDRSQIHFSL